MSADAWIVCPKCKADAESTHSKILKSVYEAYGKVSAEEYLKRVQSTAKRPELHETLREDYEIGIYNGEFSVNYNGSCKTCGFSFSFKHKQKI